METLAALTDEYRRKIARASALDLVASQFDAKADRRLISGIAISSRRKNANGLAFVASGAKISLPVPILYDHQWNRPIGRAFAVEARGEELRFTAELCTRDAHPYMLQAWCEIFMKDTFHVSIGPRKTEDSVERSVGPSINLLMSWELDEISIVDAGADPDARIVRCWRQSPVVSLHRPSTITHWREEQ